MKSVQMSGLAYKYYLIHIYSFFFGRTETGEFCKHFIELVAVV